MWFPTIRKEGMFLMFRLIGRHFKEAFQGIFRHFAMALSSANAVTVTLVLVSLLTLIVGNVSQITKNLEENIQIYVKIDKELDEVEIPALQRRVEAIDGVGRVEYSNKDQELDRFINGKGEGGKIFEIYREDNPLSPAFLVEIKSGYTLSGVSEQIGKINGIKEVEYGGATADDFLRVLTTVRTSGYIIILALTLLAIFLINNTINITIHNRNEEIAIMRQVGASNSYVRQPFVIEGIFIGLFGAIIPALATIFGYKYIYDTLNGQLISGMLTLLPTNPFAYYVAAFLAVIGMVVGLIGSLLSVNRQLRWRR